MLSTRSTQAHAHEIRRLILEVALRSGTTHIASALSIADILAALYFDGARRFADRGDGSRGDRFLLSKGHAGSALLAALAVDGTVSRERLLAEYCRDGGMFAGHAERAVPGVEINSGSLGHGLAIAVGLALADRSDAAGRTTFCLLGDGELQEGSVWEAAGLAGHLRLTNLVAIVDANGMQGLGHVEDVTRMEPLDRRFRSFGWETVEVDGHDHEALRAAFRAPAGDRPRCVLARTVKGAGVDFMEGDWRAHYTSFRPHDRERVMAALERGGAARALPAHEEPHAA